MTTPNANTLALTADPKFMASFKEGWLCGFTWPEIWNHKPGGPWVFTAGFNPKPEWVQKAIDSKKSHDCWLAGWAFGNAQKNRTWTVDEHVAAAKAF